MGEEMVTTVHGHRVLEIPSSRFKNVVNLVNTAKYGKKWVRTRTIIDNFIPKWNEQYTWEVFDPCTVITIGVFDNCHFHGGDSDDKASKDAKAREVVNQTAATIFSAFGDPILWWSANPMGVCPIHARDDFFWFKSGRHGRQSAL